MKLVIVGGVAGGASAATRARRLSEESQIVLFERGPDVSFANCGLPYHIGGEIADRSKLLVVTPQRLKERFNLDVRVRSSVESIDRAAKTVQIRELDTGREYDESYDKLILAPGAAPLRPPIPGIDLPDIHTLRNLQDMDRIKARIDSGVRQAVVVGAGFIGLELVENFVRRGIATTLVELQDQVLPPFDKEMTTPLAESLAAHGVRLILGDSAEAFESTDDGIAVRLKSGQRLPAQLVVLGHRRSAGKQAGGRCRAGGRPARRHSRQRAVANERSRHLRRRRRHRGPRRDLSASRRRSRSPARRIAKGASPPTTSSDGMSAIAARKARPSSACSSTRPR